MLDKKSLLAIGLTENEILVYKKLFEVDKLSVRQLVERTKIKRGNIYIVLYSLVKKGLIQEFDFEKKKHFKIKHPEKLLSLAKNKTKEIETATENVESDIKELVKKYASNKSGVNCINMYGSEGLEYVYKTLARTKNYKRVICQSVDSIEKKHVKIIRDGLRLIKTYKVAGKVIACGRSVLSDWDVYRNVETKILTNVKDFGSDIYIVKDKVIFIDYSDGIVVSVLEDNLTYRMMEIAFDSLYVQAKDFVDDDKENKVNKNSDEVEIQINIS